MAYDYGTKEANDRERARLMEEGRAARRAGKSDFGAGGYKPGDMMRAHDWLMGWREENTRLSFITEGKRNA